MRFLFGIFSRKSWFLIAGLLTLFYLGIQLPFLVKVPIIVTDEPWYANTAYNWISGHGLINTNTGWRGGDQLFLWTMVCGVFFKLFGTTLFAGRLAAAVMGLGSLWGFVACLREMGARKSSVLISGVLWSLCSVFYVVFRRIRPEALLVALCIWGLFFLIRYWKWFRVRDMGYSGFLLGLGCVTHPIGIFLTVITGGMLFFDRRRVSVVCGYVLGIVVAAGVFLLGWGLFKQESLVSFIYEIIHNDRTSSGMNPFVVGYRNIFYFVPTYTLGLKRVYIFICELGLLGAGLFYFRKNSIAFRLSVMGILCVTMMFMVLNPFFRTWICVPVIFPFLIFGGLSTQWMSSRYRWVFFCLTSIYALNSFSGDAYMMIKGYQNASYEVLSQKIRGAVPKDAVVMTQIQFWFPLKENRIYNSSTQWGKMAYPSLEASVHSGETTYAVLCEKLNDDVSPTTGKKELIYGGNKGYYGQALGLAKARGVLVEEIFAEGYGAVQVYRLAR